MTQKKLGRFAPQTERYEKSSKKLESPNKLLKNIVTRQRQIIVDGIVATGKYTKEEALNLLENDGAYEELLKDKRKQIELQIADSILPQIQRAIDKKLESGSLEQAQRGMIALSIGHEKVFQSKDRIVNQSLQLKGQNMQINLGFDFKPYNKKEKTKTLKQE